MAGKALLIFVSESGDVETGSLTICNIPLRFISMVTNDTAFLNSRSPLRPGRSRTRSRWAQQSS